MMSSIIEYRITCYTAYFPLLMNFKEQSGYGRLLAPLNNPIKMCVGRPNLK